MSFCRGQTQILPRQTFFLETRDMCTAHRNKENQIFKQSNVEILILLKYIALLTNGLDIPPPPHCKTSDQRFKEERKFLGSIS